MASLPHLTQEHLIAEAKVFSEQESAREDAGLFGSTDGKAVGTYLEHRFRAFLQDRYTFEAGNSASGIDFPGIGVDMKTTSIRQPQSSCPFKSARQKIYGLGYGVLIFVYEKEDDTDHRTSRLHIHHTVFVDQGRTADFQMTKGILEIVGRDGNVDDIQAFLSDRNLPVDEIEALAIAEDVLANPPRLGYLTISNALQWRLQYGRVISEAGHVDGVLKVR